jgi:peroxiredoxin/predicted  nucleic acid-binding Zn-ribbon protein
MTRLRPFFSVAALLCLLALAAPAPGQGRYGQFVGKPFPGFRAQDALTGERIDLKDFRGRVVLIDFWATWCGPCVRELPNVKRSYGKYHDQGFEIISISLDKDRARFRKFARAQQMNWHHVMEGGGWSTRLAKQYGINSIPAMFLLDPDGIVLSASARGRALDQAIEEGLRRRRPDAGDPDAVDDKKPQRPADPHETVALRTQLKDSAIALRVAGGPLDKLEASRGAAERSLGSLERQIEGSSTSPRALLARYARLHEQMAELRHRMFVDGLLNDRTVRLPAGPMPLDDGGADHRAIAGVAAALPGARAGLETMGTALGRRHQEIDALKAKLDRAEGELRGGDLETSSAAIEAVTQEVTAAAGSGEPPWERQLRIADTVVAELAGTAGIEQELDALDADIKACRELLASSADAASAMKLRERFSKFYGRLAVVSARPAVTGAFEGLPQELPPDPLSHLRMRDARDRVEAGRALDRVAATVQTMREAAVGTTARVAGLQERIRALQAELDRAGGRRTGLEMQFESVCDEVLAALDQ